MVKFETLTLNTYYLQKIFLFFILLACPFGGQLKANTTQEISGKEAGVVLIYKDSIQPLWRPGEIVGVYAMSEGNLIGPLPFTISSNGGLLEPVPIFDPFTEHTYLAYHPFDANTSTDPAHVNAVVISNHQVQQGASNDHLKLYEFNVAQPVKAYAGESISFYFSSVFSYFEYHITTNVPGLTVNSIELIAPQGKVLSYTSATVDITKQFTDPAFGRINGIVGGESSITLDINGGLAIPNSSVVYAPAYMAVNPFDAQNETMYVKVQTNQGEFMIDFSGENYRIGSNYIIPVRIEINQTPPPEIVFEQQYDICQSEDITQLNITYSATGDPDQYMIDWDDSANNAGLEDIPYTSLPVSPLELSIQGNIPPGTYNGILKVMNSISGEESNGAPIIITVHRQPLPPQLDSKYPDMDMVCEGTNVSATFISGSEGQSCEDMFRYSTDNGISWNDYTSGQEISTLGIGKVIIQGKRGDCDPSFVCGDTEWIEMSAWTMKPLPTATFVSGNVTIRQGETATLRIQLTGDAPWELVYNNGTTNVTILINNPIQPHELQISPSVTTTYTLVRVRETAGCSNAATGSVTVTVIETPEPPEPPEPPKPEPDPRLQWSVSKTHDIDRIFYDIPDNIVTDVMVGTPVYLQIRPVVDSRIIFDSWRIDYSVIPEDHYYHMGPINAQFRYNFNNGEPHLIPGTYVYIVESLTLYRSEQVVGYYEYSENIEKQTIIIREPPQPEPAIEIKDIAPFCYDDKEFRIPFDLLYTDGPLEYIITFSDEALEAGFENITTFKPLLGNYIPVPVSAKIPQGIYKGSVYLRQIERSEIIDLYPFEVEVLPFVQITKQPQSVTHICEGDGFTLSIEAEGENLTYQWYKDDKPINGATSAIYSELLRSEQTGLYYVIVSGDCGTEKSDEAKVVINTFRIHIKWDDVLYVINTNNEYVDYQWYKDGSPITTYGKSIYYTDPEGLLGTYAVRAYKKDGTYDESCSMYFETNKSSVTYIYPNPVKRQSYLSVENEEIGEESEAKIELFDLTGKKVYQTKTRDSRTTIPVIYPQGNYILKINLRNDKVITRKIIVE